MASSTSRGTPGRSGVNLHGRPTRYTQSMQYHHHQIIEHRHQAGLVPRIGGAGSRIAMGQTLGRVAHQAGSSPTLQAIGRSSPGRKLSQGQASPFSHLLDFFSPSEELSSPFFGSMTASPGPYVDDQIGLDPLPLGDKTSSTSSIPTKRPAIQAKAAQKRNRIDRPHGEDEDGDCRMSGDDTDSKKPHDGKSFACPYYRKDPLRHLDCINLKLNRIPDVKQHLKRRHTPSYSCQTCFEGFSELQAFENHLRFRNCAPRSEGANVDGVSPRAQELLKNRIDRRLSQKEQWHKIWKILFEDPETTQNPHLNNVVEEVIGIIRDFCKNDGNQVVSGYVQRQGLPPDSIDQLHPLLLELLDEVQVRFEQRPNESNLRESASMTDSSPREATWRTKQEPIINPAAFPLAANDGCYSPSVFQSVASTPSIHSSTPSSIVSEPDYTFLSSGLPANVPPFNGPQIQSTTNFATDKMRGSSSIDAFYDRVRFRNDSTGGTLLPSSPTEDCFEDFFMDQ
ncbi:hypothetical protein FDECE_13901 [Fusarium decemcellulare]|nr:hypothetical protein FDECE_13901 [Fusarium decemcellulare]